MFLSKKIVMLAQISMITMALVENPILHTLLADTRHLDLDRKEKNIDTDKIGFNADPLGRQNLFSSLDEQKYKVKIKNEEDKGKADKENFFISIIPIILIIFGIGIHITILCEDLMYLYNYIFKKRVNDILPRKILNKQKIIDKGSSYIIKHFETKQYKEISDKGKGKEEMEILKHK